LRLSLRFVLPLVLILAGLAYAVMPLADRLTLRWFTSDLDSRSRLIANTIDEPLESLLALEDSVRIRQFFTRMAQDERLYAMALCEGAAAAPTISTPAFPPEMSCADAAMLAGSRELRRVADVLVLVSIRPLTAGERVETSVILVHDVSFVDRRAREVRNYVLYVFIALAILLSAVTAVIAQLSWREWVQGLRSLMRGERRKRRLSVANTPELRPIAEDLRALIRDIETEHRLRDEERVTWNAETLREILHRELQDQEVIVVSNRQPYIHVRQNGDIVLQRPASGVVTAIEPIMRACLGTWVAHGSGTADRETVDKTDRIAVPPGRPEYLLRRVWLTEEEEEGYYYGFANEGLWPLCHISHVRPTFRASDWQQYVAANRRFANAVVEEASSSDPIVLVQDYHFAVLPRMIREALPDATVITFWHIPWPNPEAFSICPWREELLDGLLGSSILGFHTQNHCNNFADTVDRLLEARADRETFTVSYKGELTAIKRYPISIEWPPSADLLAKPVEECRVDVRRRYGLPDDHKLGLGIDRLDYTKGVEERFRAVERLLETHPEWVGRFTFLQIAAPTRARLEIYQGYETRVRSLASEINERFAADYPAILLVVEHQEPEQVYEFYRACDVCFISSLHDGMNLVAKEFVAARDDDAGVLVLSQFTGASRELPESLIVNPYDADQCAAALNAALTMPPETQRARMTLMRGLVSEFNVYRWAGRMLIDAATMRRRRLLLGDDPRSAQLAPGNGSVAAPRNTPVNAR
jgi:trehalose 6-phosphate synthase